jgi:hypothetical protein
MILRQTSIKHLFEGCPKKWQGMWIDKTIHFPSNEKQNLGKYFEYLVLGKGAIENDEVTDLPRLKNGSKSVSQLRIEAQAQKCSEWLNPLSDNFKGWRLVESQVHNIIPDEKRGVKLSYTIDFIGENFYDELSLFDLKLTSDVTATRHPKHWGHDVEDLDLFQGKFYISNYKKQFNKEVPFRYWIFDYTKDENVLKILLDPSKEVYEEVDDILSDAVSLINKYKKIDFEERVPSKDECETCPLSCSKRFINQQIITNE